MQKKVGGVRVLRAQELSKNDAKNTDEVYVLHAQEVSRNNVENRIRERGVNTNSARSDGNSVINFGRSNNNGDNGR